MIEEDQGFLMHLSIWNMTTTDRDKAIALNIQHINPHQSSVVTYLDTCWKKYWYTGCCSCNLEAA